MSFSCYSRSFPLEIFGVQEETESENIANSLLDVIKCTAKKERKKYTVLSQFFFSSASCFFCASYSQKLFFANESFSFLASFPKRSLDKSLSAENQKSER